MSILFEIDPKVNLAAMLSQCIFIPTHSIISGDRRVLIDITIESPNGFDGDLIKTVAKELKEIGINTNLRTASCVVSAEQLREFLELPIDNPVIEAAQNAAGIKLEGLGADRFIKH